MSDTPKDRMVDQFLQTPHTPHQYATYAGGRLYDSEAFDEAFDALDAMPRLPEPGQAERDRCLRVLRSAWEQGDTRLAETARWSEDVPSIACVYDMGEPDSGGTVWLHNAWNAMVREFVVALSHRAAR